MAWEEPNRPVRLLLLGEAHAFRSEQLCRPQVHVVRSLVGFKRTMIRNIFQRGEVPFLGHKSPFGLQVDLE